MDVELPECSVVFFVRLGMRPDDNLYNVKEREMLLSSYAVILYMLLNKLSRATSELFYCFHNDL